MRKANRLRRFRFKAPPPLPSARSRRYIWRAWRSAGSQSHLLCLTHSIIPSGREELQTFNPPRQHALHPPSPPDPGQLAFTAWSPSAAELRSPTLLGLSRFAFVFYSRRGAVGYGFVSHLSPDVSPYLLGHGESTSPGGSRFCQTSPPIDGSLLCVRADAPLVTSDKDFFKCCRRQL